MRMPIKVEIGEGSKKTIITGTFDPDENNWHVFSSKYGTSIGLDIKNAQVEGQNGANLAGVAEIVRS